MKRFIALLTTGVLIMTVTFGFVGSMETHAQVNCDYQYMLPFDEYPPPVKNRKN